MRVMLVHDRVSPAKIEDTLKSQGLAVDVAEPEEMRDFTKVYSYGLIGILGIDPEKTAQIIQGFKREHAEVPVFAIFPDGPRIDTTTLLKAGADAVLSEPVDTAELTAHCQALLRRPRGFSQAKLVVGPLEIDQETRSANIRGTPLALSPKEFAILEMLVLNKGVVMSKQALHEQLYAGLEGPHLNIIQVFICKIRQAIRRAGGGDLIKNIHGMGYLLRHSSEETPDHPRADVAAAA